MGLLENTIGAMLGHKAGEGSDRPTGGSPYAPLAAALIAMLAGKAMTGGFGDLGGLLGGHRGGDGRGGDTRDNGQPSFLPPQSPAPGTASEGQGGGLLSGLGNLFNHFQSGGAANPVKSWIGSGPNETASPNEISQALGPDTIRELARRFNMPEDEVARRLSQELPEAVNKLTPQGRLPTQDEMSAWR